MAEFSYDNQPTPTMALLDASQEHGAGWALKRHMMPTFYFDMMLSDTPKQLPTHEVLGLAGRRVCVVGSPGFSHQYGTTHSAA